ncbi:MAG: DedA family protein [Desulfurivibrio sp.]|nr:DedA family protein [Desulfurivibrio sp.]
MSADIFALVSDWGPVLIFASAFLSCLAVPIPTSLMMLAGGAFVASDDLALWHVVVAALTGAILGDQTGYLIGRRGGAPLVTRIARSPKRRAALARARTLVDRWGGPGVFFSTWLFAPLGPWVNFIAGTTALSWRRFSIWDVLGETIWVSVYVTLGVVFASRIEAVADLLGNAVGLLVGLAVAGVMAVWIRGALRSQKAGG